MLNPNIRDNAISEGYSLLLNISGTGEELTVYARPDADLDGRFVAVDAETGDTLRVNGWAISIDAFEYLAAA